MLGAGGGPGGAGTGAAVPAGGKTPTHHFGLFFSFSIVIQQSSCLDVNGSLLKGITGVSTRLLFFNLCIFVTFCLMHQVTSVFFSSTCFYPDRNSRRGWSWCWKESF